MTEDLILDGTKLAWYADRVAAWERGERIAPITIDMALTRKCQSACGFCYATTQENEGHEITAAHMRDFLDDCAEIGVRGVSFVSDGESTLSPAFVPSIVHGSSVGLSMAVGTNAVALNRKRLEEILPHLTYLRVNISGGERKRYGQIMGCRPDWFDRVCQNIRDMVEIKRRHGLGITIGMQMVLDPKDGDQVLPLARLGKELRPDYLIIKHCSDDEDGTIGVDYGGYDALRGILHEAEAMSDDDYKVVVKWSKIEAMGKRTYQRCYGSPFLLQISGSGLVASCGMLFNARYKKLHIGNICETRFRDIWASDRYWEVMRYLASPEYDAQKMCGSLCLQHKVNEALDAHRKGLVRIQRPSGDPPAHLDFV